MVRAYEVILHERAWAALASAKAVEKHRLLALLETIKGASFRAGDFQQRDASGRSNEVLLAGEWLMTFWSDHAVAEIHVVNQERVED